MSAPETTTIAAQIEALVGKTTDDGWSRGAASVKIGRLVLENLSTIVTALRQAEAAPVAWRYEYRDNKEKPWRTHYSATEVRVQHANCDYIRNPQPLYAAPISHPQAEAAPGVVVALERVLSATTLRALRGRDHVPSMREEQDACSQARAALAIARQHGARKDGSSAAYLKGWNDAYQRYVQGDDSIAAPCPAAPATDEAPISHNPEKG